MLGTQRKWINEINAMHEEMDRWFDYVAGRKPPAFHFAPRGWTPSIDVYETSNEVVVLVELAGIEQEDVEITAEGSSLVLRGQRQDTAPERKKCYYQMEIQWGTFERSILLPAVVDSDQSHASYQKGFLEIVLPKSAKAKTHKVNLKKT